MAVVTPGGMARAQPAPGTIVGEVRTAAEGTPLPAANLQLEGTLLGGITDRGGRYRIPGVPPGSYRLRVSVVGYRTETATVAVVSGGTVTVDVRLEIAPIALPDVVVTAGRQQQRADEAAAAVAILEGPRLALRGARQLDTVLPLVPGVTMMDDQVGIRGSTGYTRGAGGRVLVLQDGVPVVGGDTGNVRWDTLPAEAVERVEVVKGATSSLYGSAAMGGVVNVITRSAHTGPFTSVRLRTGTWDQPWYEDYRWSEGRRWSRGGEATLVRPVGRLGLLVTGGYLRSDGFRQNGGEEKKHLLAKLEGPLEGRDHWDVVLTAALHDHDNFFEWAGPDDPYEVAAAVRGDWIRSDKLTLTSSWRRLLSPSAYIQVQPHFSAVRWSNHFADNNDAAEVLRSGIDLQRVHTWGDASLTVGGMAALTGVEADMYGSVRVGEGAVFTQHERGLSERVRMSVGARLDFHQARGLEHHLVVSPRLALVADPLPGLVLRLAGGRGFRAPSVAETYVSTTTSGFQVIPNTALTPETA